MAAHRIASLLKASPEGEGVHPSQNATLKGAGVRRSPRDSGPAIGHCGSNDSEGKPCAAQERLKTGVAAKAVNNKWISDGAVHIRIAYVGGLRQPFQGEVFPASMRVREEDVDGSHVGPAQPFGEPIANAPHRSRVTRL